MEKLLWGIVLVPFLLLTSAPGQALAYSQERDVAWQHLRFTRGSGVTSQSVLGTQTNRNSSVVPEEGMTYTVTATAYSSTVEETDADPFTTAAGTRVRLGTLAVNWLPLGTQVLLGGQHYTVLDRMNSRFTVEHRRVDVWVQSPDIARAFGTRTLELKIVSLP